MAYRHPHGFRWQHRPQKSAGSLVIIRTPDINIDYSCGWTSDPDLALKRLHKSGHHCGLRGQCGPLTSAWSSPWTPSDSSPAPPLFRTCAAQFFLFPSLLREFAHPSGACCLCLKAVSSFIMGLFRKLSSNFDSTLFFEVGFGLSLTMRVARLVSESQGSSCFHLPSRT